MSCRAVDLRNYNFKTAAKRDCQEMIDLLIKLIQKSCLRSGDSGGKEEDCGPSDEQNDNTPHRIPAGKTGGGKEEESLGDCDDDDSDESSSVSTENPCMRKQAKRITMLPKY